MRIGLYDYQVSQVVKSIGVWHSLSSQDGIKEEYYHQWQRVGINSINPAGWKHWLLLRRNIKEPKKVSYYIAFCREETGLEELVKAAGSSRIIEACFQTSKGELGLDDYEVRSYVGWYRHITLCLVGLLLLEEMREYFS